MSGQIVALLRSRQEMLAITFQKGYEKGTLALVRWSSFKAWGILHPEWEERMNAGLGNTLWGLEDPRPKPPGGPPARCACSPGVRCGAGEPAGRSRRHLHSSCTCSFCALPPQRWWSEMEKTNKPRKTMYLLFHWLLKTTSGTQLPVTGGVLAAEHKLNQDFGEMANFSTSEQMQNLTRYS